MRRHGRENTRLFKLGRIISVLSFWMTNKQIRPNLWHLRVKWFNRKSDRPLLNFYRSTIVDRLYSHNYLVFDLHESFLLKGPPLSFLNAYFLLVRLFWAQSKLNRLLKGGFNFLEDLPFSLMLKWVPFLQRKYMYHLSSTFLGTLTTFQDRPYSIRHEN